MQEIDIVVAWVDGSDPAHSAKRKRWEPAEANRNSTQPRRFSDNDEIRYCLRSIKNHAPWVRTIWLVTDNQFPRSISRSLAEEAGIQVVSHQEIFAGLEELLPTFNSLSIEAMLWRIEGLADHYLYMNDDMMFTGTVKPEDFFPEDKVVLRGKWLDWRELEKLAPHGHHKLNGARLEGFDISNFFSSTHVPYPFVRPLMASLFEKHRADLIRSACFRFRDNSQIWPVSLHHHQLINEGRALIRKPTDVVHFSVAQCKNGGTAELSAKLDRLTDENVIMTCVNYVEALREKVPDLYARLDGVTGIERPFEA